MAKTISFYDVLVNFVSLITFMLDVGTDILVAVELFEYGNIVWGSLTAGFVAVPTIIIQIFSVKWHITDKTLTPLTCLPHLFLFAPVQRYLRVIRLALKARSTRSFYDIDRVYREQNDVCILRLLESFMESAPQLCLQLYIILSTNQITPLTGISIAGSLVSLAWALTAYGDGLRLAYRDVYERNWCSLFVHWMWQTSMTAARVTALVVFASIFKAWVFLLAGIHWVAMTIWISIQGTDFGDGPCERGLFQIVAGFIYIFCFMNLRDGQSRRRMLAYYLVLLLESAAIVAVWFVYKQPTPILDYVTPSVVFGGFLFGVICLLIYYRFLHPSGPLYLYTTKAVVNNGVLNNQRDMYPGLFDRTAGTPLSVLGSDIIELSRDMDGTYLSVSRISNRSSITFSQQHLQLAWEAGFVERSSSSDSSIDMMGIGTSRSCHENNTLTSSRSASSTRQLLSSQQADRSSRIEVYTDRQIDVSTRSMTYRDQADRRDVKSCHESTTDKRKPRHKVFNEKDLYGFHEHRFHGTYYSPAKRDDITFEAPPSLSPLDAGKLWEETTGRLRAPLVGKEDDTLSSLDAAELVDQSYGRRKSMSSWSSLGRLASSRNSLADDRLFDKGSNFRQDSRSYLESSLPHLVDYNFQSNRDGENWEQPESYLENTRDPIHMYGHQQPSTNRSLERSARTDRSSYHSSKTNSHTSDSDISEEQESGVFSNKSWKNLNYQDVSLQDSPEPVYAMPHGQHADPYHLTQSAPGPARSKKITPQDLPEHCPEDQGIQYSNMLDIHKACDGTLPDTPWKLDYLNLEPLKTVLMRMKNIPEGKKQLVKEYLRDLNESLSSNGSCQPTASPLKMQDFQNSPARFGRNIDLFDSHAYHAEKENSKLDEDKFMMQGIRSKSQRSLNSTSSDRPLSGEYDSGYQPFSRCYLDSQNRLKEQSPYSVGRHSSKMSTIRGDVASAVPVKGSPMPVRNRSKDRIEKKKSLDDIRAKRSNSQTSLNGRYKKRLSNENKENTSESYTSNQSPYHKKYSPNSHKSTPRFDSIYHNDPSSSEVPEDLCPSLTGSYRQAINNTARSFPSLSSSQSHLRLEDLTSDTSNHEVQGYKKSTSRQPFQTLQNSPAFSPIGNIRNHSKTDSDEAFSSTPKVSSTLHSLALIDTYRSPVDDLENQSGSNQRSRPIRNKQRPTDRAKSVDYIR